MAKIPKIDKFKEDNEQNFSLWIEQYEAHCVGSWSDRGEEIGHIIMLCGFPIYRS